MVDGGEGGAKEGPGAAVPAADAAGLGRAQELSDNFL